MKTYENDLTEIIAEVGQLNNKNNYMTKSLVKLLTSYRFWGVVGTAASLILTNPAFLTDPWFVSLGKFLGLVFGGATLVGVADRVGSHA